MSCRGTRFNEWSDKPVSVAVARYYNRQLYPNVKSRYTETVARWVANSAAAAKKRRTPDRYADWLKKWEAARLAENNDLATVRARLLTPAELAYLEMIEADGQLDGAAAALGYLMAADRPLDGPRFDRVVCALSEDDGSPLALTLAAMALVHDCGEDEDDRWQTAELCLLAALSLADGDPDEAKCLQAAGWFYAFRGRPLVAVQFLDSARRCAADKHSDGDRMRLPADVRHATKSTEPTDEAYDDDDVWTTACFAEHEVLMQIARDLDEDRAMRAMLAACRLIEWCGPRYNGHRAAVLYQLGVRYADVGDSNTARRRFVECAAAAALADDGHLELDAQLEAASVGPGPADVGVLEWIVERALDKGDGRVLVKAIAKQGRAAADGGRPDDAYSLFALSNRLAADARGRAGAVDELVRLRAAVCRTCTHLQSSFRQLSGLGFDLFAESVRWTGTRSPLVLRDPHGQAYLHAETFQDGVVKSRALTMLRRLPGLANDDMQ